MSRRAGVIIALLCVLCHIGSCVNFMDCGLIEPLSNFTKVSVTGCKESDEWCSLAIGTNSTISITFELFTCVEFFFAQASSLKENVPMPFMVLSTTCLDPNSGLRCPLCMNTVNTLNATMFVQWQYPKDLNDIYVRWEFRDNYNRLILCVQFPARIA